MNVSTPVCKRPSLRSLARFARLRAALATRFEERVCVSSMRPRLQAASPRLQAASPKLQAPGCKQAACVRVVLVVVVVVVVVAVVYSTLQYNTIRSHPINIRNFLFPNFSGRRHGNLLKWASRMKFRKAKDKQSTTKAYRTIAKHSQTFLFLISVAGATGIYQNECQA